MGEERERMKESNRESAREAERETNIETYPQNVTEYKRLSRRELERLTERHRE